jgi:hypothetical protein
VDGQPNGYYDNGRWFTANGDRENAGYIDRDGNWVPASSVGYYDTSGRWVASRAYGYYDARGRWVSTRQGSYQNNDNGPNNPYRPGTGQYALNQMPTDIAGRISWMRAYIPNAVQSQHMNRTNAQYARRELTAIETQNRQFNRDGRFTQREGQMIQRRLDRLTIRFQQSERKARNN